MKGILCDYKEYRLKEDNWYLFSRSEYEVDMNFINNMLDSSLYFSKLGGYMNIQYRNSKFGCVVNKIVSISICGSVKKVLSFRYS